MLGETTRIVETMKGGKTYHNKASAQDYCRFLISLYRGELPQSGELLRLMALPKPHNRLVSGVKEIPSGTILFDKTGTTGMLVGDFGIVSPIAPDGTRWPYIVVGILEKAHHCGDAQYPDWSKSRANLLRVINGQIFLQLQAYFQWASTQAAQR
jgi:beta-lactamase class A